MAAAVFDVAYFFHIDPAAVMALPWRKFELYVTQMIRISDQIDGATRGDR